MGWKQTILLSWAISFSNTNHSSLLRTFGLNATSPNNSYLPLIFRKFALNWGHFQNVSMCRFRGRWGCQGQTTSKLTREPSYSSFFSAWCTDFKNVIFEKIHWTPSEAVEVKRSFSRPPRPNFGFHLVLTSFHLEFLSFWILRLFDLSNLSVLENGTRKHFENGLKSMQNFQRLMGGINCR